METPFFTHQEAAERLLGPALRGNPVREIRVEDAVVHPETGGELPARRVGPRVDHVLNLPLEAAPLRDGVAVRVTLDLLEELVRGRQVVDEVFNTREGCWEYVKADPPTPPRSSNQGQIVPYVDGGNPGGGGGGNPGGGGGGKRCRGGKKPGGGKGGKGPGGQGGKAGLRRLR